MVDSLAIRSLTGIAAVLATGCGRVGFDRDAIADGATDGASDVATVPAARVANAQFNFSAAAFDQPITVPPSGQPLLLVFIHPGEEAVTTMTYAGAALTRAIATTGQDPDSEAWYLVGPPIGTANLSVALTGPTAFVGTASWAVYEHVNPVVPVGDVEARIGTDATPTVQLAAADDDVVVCGTAINMSISDLPIGPGATEWADNGTAAASEAPGSAATTMSWMLGAAANWSIVAVAIKPG